MLAKQLLEEFYQKFRRTFVDIDLRVEKASGQKIHHIFEKYGEDEFRKIEKKIVQVS